MADPAYCFSRVRLNRSPERSSHSVSTARLTRRRLWARVVPSLLRDRRAFYRAHFRETRKSDKSLECVRDCGVIEPRTMRDTTNFLSADRSRPRQSLRRIQREKTVTFAFSRVCRTRASRKQKAKIRNFFQKGKYLLGCVKIKILPNVASRTLIQLGIMARDNVYQEGHFVTIAQRGGRDVSYRRVRASKLTKDT